MKALLLALALGAAMAGAASAQVPPPDRPLYEEGVVAVKLRDVPSAHRLPPGGAVTGIASLDGALAEVGARSLEPAFQLHPRAYRGGGPPEVARIYYVRYAGGEGAEAVARRLGRDPAVEYAERVPLHYSHGTPTDELFGLLHHLPQIQAVEAWAIHRGQDGGQDVVVAITDSGVEWYHPDLAANIWHNLGEDANANGRTLIPSGASWAFDPGDLNGLDDDGNGYIDDLIGWNFSERRSNDPNTGDEHGTHVAGIAGAATDNGTGVASISHNVKLMPVSAWDPRTQTLPNAYQLMIYAAENGAHIINASWGSLAYSRAGEEAVAYARGLGSIVVASAGNNNTAEPNYPASYPGVVSVGSVAVTDARATYSSHGPSVWVSAPGGQGSLLADGGILSTGSNGTYVRYQGTSMAAPLVTGLLALVKSYRPTWSNEQVVKQVLGSSDDIDPLNPAFAGMLGSGRINAYRALTETSLTLPQGLRLHLPVAEFRDEVVDGFYTVGEAIHLDVRLGNYAAFVNAGEVTLRLESGDPTVVVLTGPYSAPLPSDGHLEASFELRILPGATTGTVPLRLHVTADTPIASGDAFNLELPVAAGGVLVWDGRAEEGYYSGRFIYEFLRQQGVPAVYRRNVFDPLVAPVFPETLAPFDAVFLSFGAGIHMMTTMQTAWRNRVETYVRGGGRVYIEGSTALGDGGFNSSPTLMAALGIAAIQPGPFEKDAPVQLVGQAGSILEGFTLPGYGQQPIRVVNRYTASESGREALEEPDFGMVAIQGETTSGGRSFVSSYALVNMEDGPYPSQRRNLLMRVLDFFGVEAPAGYAHLDFSADARTGHAPLTVQFADRSSTSLAGGQREWDFDGDGTPDATGPAPTWTYTEPGVYPVRLRISEGAESLEHHRDAYVRVFDGASSLSFGAPAGSLKIPTYGVFRLNLSPFTVEAWIRPTGWGVAPLGLGRIIDKHHLAVYVETGGHLVLRLNHPGLRTSYFSTDVGAVTLDAWQHVAVTYDDAGHAQFFVNGLAQPVNTFRVVGTAAENNTWFDLHVGNDAAGSLPFQGEIDELRVWNRVRTAEELLADLHVPVLGTETGLIGYWPFDEGRGGTAQDVTPFGVHGEVAGAEWRAGYRMGSVGVDEASALPAAPLLLPNHPNPFRSATTIGFRLGRDERVTLEVFNPLGQRVAVLADQRQPAGEYTLSFDGSALASGVYIYRLQTDSGVAVRRMVLLR
jgi:serine protease